MSTPVSRPQEPAPPSDLQSESQQVAQPLPLSELLKQSARVPEIGGRSDGPEPTRYGDWEKNGRCIDF